MHLTLKSFKIVLLFFVLLTLYSCESTNEDTEPTTHLYTHDLTKNNFESFFDVSYNLNFDNTGAYTIDFHVEPKFDFIIDDINVTFHIDVMEIYGDFEEERTYQITRFDFVVIDHLFESSDTDGLTQAYISKFDLSISPTSLNTDDMIEVQTKSYPVTYEKPGPPPKFEILDPTQNRLNYEGLMAIFNKFDHVNPNHISFELKESLNIEYTDQNQAFSSSTKLDFIMEPFYMMIESQGVKEVITATPDQNSFIYFSLNESIKQGNDYLVRPIPLSHDDVMAYLSLTMTDPDELMTDYMFDASKMLFETLPNGYRITAMLKDMLEADAYQDLVELYDELGVNADVLEDALIKFLVFNLNDLYHFVVELTMEVNEPFKQTITSRNEYIYDFSVIEPISLETLDVIILPALSPETIANETNPLEVVMIHETPMPHYYKVYLEEGQYIMNVSSTEIDINIMDESLALIDDKHLYQNPGTGIYQHTFFIDQEGYYIFEAETTYHIGPYLFKVDKLEFTSNLSEPETLVLGDNTFSISDMYDIKYVLFDAPEDMIISISGHAKDLRFIKELSWSPGTYQIGFLFEFGFETVYLKVEEGLNAFYFVNETPIDFTIHIEDYGDLSHQSDDISLMTAVSENYLEVPLLIGNDIGPSYVRLDAVHGLYTFYAETGVSFLSPMIRLYEANTNTFIDYIYTDVVSPMVLDEGTYYLKVESHNNYLVNIRYDMMHYENQVIDEVIASYPTYDISGEEFPYFEGVFIDKNHRPTHRFTLNEPQAVVIATSPHHQLFDEEGKLLTFRHLNFSHSRIIYFLEAGTYDLKPYTNHSSGVLIPYQIKIAVVENEIVQDNYYPKEMATFLYEGGTIQFTDNHSHDYEVIEIVITKRVTYRLSGNKQFHIYDGLLNQIEGFTANTSKLITLEPGVYYIATHRFPIGDFRLTIWPPEYDE